MNNYTQADQQLHRLCQIMAKANRSFVPEKEDDSHTNLGFNADKKQIEGRWIETTSENIRLILRLTDVCYVWQDEKEETIQTVSTAKKYIQDIEQQVAKTIQDMGLDVNAFNEPLHFEIPDYHFTNQPVALLSRLALNEWIFWRALANKACDYLLDKLDQEVETRIWPHHFDTGIYSDVNENLGIGFGLAMKDDKVNAPYFYATCYPKNGEADYSKVPSLSHGKWILGDWKGAVLSLNDMEFRNSEVSYNKVSTFIDETTGWYLKKE